MKRAALGFLILVLMPTMVCAEDFSIEEENLGAIPTKIAAAIHSDKSFSDYQDCKLIGRPIKLTANENSGFAVTTANVCGWGAYNGPVWVVLASEKPKVVLFYIGAGFEIGEKSQNGLRNIETGGGSAGTCSQARWKFQGGAYVNQKTRSCN